jgi:UDP-N-acetylmuramoylalanine--D-glutamate ligase
VPYGLDHPRPGGIGLVDGWIVADGVVRLALNGGASLGVEPDGRILPIDELRIPGRHNVANAMAAVAVGLLFGVPGEGLRRAAAEFPGVEHRLEEVAVVDGVRYVNDSQGTQPDAVIAAIRAFDGPLVLIAGGRDKGVELDELAAVVGERASAAVLIGESGATLEGLFRDAGLAHTERAATLDDAVARAHAIAREAIAAIGPWATAPGAPGATVLLSPAAASFDMFEDYAARGRAFKDAVAELAGRASASGEGTAQ